MFIIRQKTGKCTAKYTHFSEKRLKSPSKSHIRNPFLVA